jgi:hypothetical protein
MMRGGEKSNNKQWQGQQVEEKVGINLLPDNPLDDKRSS